MGIINMTSLTSLIFFGTIIILLGIIIDCFYNKSFENSCDINEGFSAIIDSKPVYDSKKRVINYNPSPVSQGYVNKNISFNNKTSEATWVLYQNAKPPAPKKAAYIPLGPVDRRPPPPPPKPVWRPRR
jgi:hypothetical protein